MDEPSMTPPRLRSLVLGGWLSPSLYRIVEERQEADALMRAVGGDDADDLMHEHSVRWARAHVQSMSGVIDRVPSYLDIARGVISDYCNGKLA